jgi:tRNA dimethylallyltransferase
MIPLVAIVGPTAVGKSNLALHLSRQFDCEIVNADSRQVYRYMDIGTAKPSPGERAEVRHHLIDVVDPDEDFNLALYQEKAVAAVRDIQKRGKLPFLVGGSGLYVWALLEGWRIPPVPPDPEFRRELEARATSEGVEILYEELRQSDPAAAQRIDSRNPRRVIRALEIAHQGTPPPQPDSKQAMFDFLIIGLTADRSELYRRIDARVDAMMDAGLLAEVQGLVRRGYGFDLPSMSALGYRQMGRCLQEDLDLPTAVQQMKFDTHRFSRHQYNWFRLGDRRIHWFDVEEGSRPAIHDLIARLGVQRRRWSLQN